MNGNTLYKTNVVNACETESSLAREPMKNIFLFLHESENAHTSNQNQHFQEICRDRIRITELNPNILSFIQQNTMGIGNESLPDFY